MDLKLELDSARAQGFGPESIQNSENFVIFEIVEKIGILEIFGIFENYKITKDRIDKVTK